MSDQTSHVYSFAAAAAAEVEVEGGSTGGYLGAAEPAPAAVARVAQLVAAAVTERIRGGHAASLPLDAADRERWEPTYAREAGLPVGADRVGRAQAQCRPAWLLTLLCCPSPCSG